MKCFIDDECFVGFCSKDKLQQKTGYLGYKVISPEELLSRKDLSVIIATSFGMEEIRQTLEWGDIPKIRFMMVLCTIIRRLEWNNIFHRIL